MREYRRNPDPVAEKMIPVVPCECLSSSCTVAPSYTNRPKCHLTNVFQRAQSTVPFHPWPVPSLDSKALPRGGQHLGSVFTVQAYCSPEGLVLQ